MLRAVKVPKAVADGAPPKGLPRSLAVVSSTDARIHLLYAPIRQKLIEHGVKVYAVAPSGRHVADIEGVGVEFVRWGLTRRTLNPLANLRQLLDLRRIYARIQPDIVHHYTIKPNILGAFAAWSCGVPVTITGVTGLGHIFSPSGMRQRLLRAIVRWLYRIAAMLSDRVIFQTQHDADILLGPAAPRTQRKAQVIDGGAGVNIDHYDARRVSAADQARMRAELNIPAGALVTTMASRLLYEKGVHEFVRAAAVVARRMPNVRFLLAGEPDSGNRRSIDARRLETLRIAGPVKFLGFRDDVRELLAVSDIVVHPTYYPEGIPRILIEAAAMGKPVVSTTTAGVSEIVTDGVNGLIVPVRDVQATADAMEALLRNARLRLFCGASGRRLAESRFNDAAVSERHLKMYRHAWVEAIGVIASQRVADAAVATTPAVSVIVPARDAEDTLGEALDSIFSQDYDGPLEVVVADGSDNNNTAEIVRKWPAVKLIRNAQKTIGFGINAAIQAASGDVLVRCDAHSRLPQSYVRKAVTTLLRTGAANVGGQQVPVGETFLERAVAIAMSMPLGAGDARYRLGGRNGPVDTVYLGTFRRDALMAVGGFDPTFLHNQDYEINWRLRDRGDMIWFDSELAVFYRPRGTLKRLAQQYFNYGRWKAEVLRCHPRSIRLRQLAPPVLVMGIAGALAAVAMGFAWGVLLPLSYLGALALWPLGVGIKRREWAALALAPVLATMHLSWGIGFFVPVRRSAPPKATPRPADQAETP